MASKLRTASWLLLALVGVLVLLISLASANLAYRGGYPIGGVSVTDVAAGREAVLTALRGIRGTSAGYGAGFAVLYLLVVVGPYRRGEVWSWWAVLISALVVALISLARMPLLGVPVGAGGTGPTLIQTGVIIVGLLLDVGRLRAAR